MKAIILAGGKGTRLKEISKDLPKSMVKINNKTVLEHLFQLFKKYGIKDIILSVGYKSQIIMDYYKDGRKFGVSLTYIEESVPLGTAGPIKLAKDLLNETFIVSNGDELKQINIDSMQDFHFRNNSMATLAITKVKNPEEYGTVIIKNNKITKFSEKIKDPESNTINAGFYMLEPEIIDKIPKGFAMFEKDVFPKLAKLNKLHAYQFKGKWMDTGSKERLEKARKEWNK